MVEGRKSLPPSRDDFFSRALIHVRFSDFAQEAPSESRRAQLFAAVHARGPQEEHLVPRLQPRRQPPRFSLYLPPIPNPPPLLLTSFSLLSQSCRPPDPRPHPPHLHPPTNTQFPHLRRLPRRLLRRLGLPRLRLRRPHHQDLGPRRQWSPRTGQRRRWRGQRGRERPRPPGAPECRVLRCVEPERGSGR